MKDEFIPRVGIWGQRHYNYLKKSNPTVVNVMRMKGTLEQYEVLSIPFEIFAEIRSSKGGDQVQNESTVHLPLAAEVRRHDRITACEIAQTAPSSESAHRARAEADR